MVVPKKLGSEMKIVGRKVWRAARQGTGKREKGSTNPQKTEVLAFSRARPGFGAPLLLTLGNHGCGYRSINKPSKRSVYCGGGAAGCGSAVRGRAWVAGFRLPPPATRA